MEIPFLGNVVIQQAPMSQAKVHGLMSGALRGYNGLTSLDGRKHEVLFEGGMFKGSKTVEVKTKADLGEVVQNMFGGVELEVSIPGMVVPFDSGYFNEDEAPERLQERFSEYGSKLDALKTEVLSTISQKKDEIARRADMFDAAMTKLNASYATRDATLVARALEEVAGATNWKSLVPVTQVYAGVKAMQKLASSLRRDGPEEAGPLSDYLAQTLRDSKVKSHALMWGDRRPFVLSPRSIEPVQDYVGPLDLYLVAEGLLIEHAE